MSRLPAEPRDQWTPIHERVSEKMGGYFKTQPLKLALMGSPRDHTKHYFLQSGQYEQRASRGEGRPCCKNKLL